MWSCGLTTAPHAADPDFPGDCPGVFQGPWPSEFRGLPGWLPAQDIFLPISISERKEVKENKEHKQWIRFISLFEQQEIGLFLSETDLHVK